MENLKDLSLADLDSLHEQMLKEQGYAGTGRAAFYAAEIASIVNEKNSRLGDGLRANVQGGIVPAVYDNGTVPQEGGGTAEATASAEVLAHGASADFAEREARIEADHSQEAGASPDTKEAGSTDGKHVEKSVVGSAKGKKPRKKK